MPSQFSHEILNANPYAYLDDAPLEERRARAVEMRRMLPESILQEVGRLDPAAIAQVRDEAWPDVRDADELHDVLHTLVALPEHCPGPAGSLAETALPAATKDATEPWRHFFERLVFEGRAGVATVGEDASSGEQPARQRRYWVAAEKVRCFPLLFPSARFEQPVPEVPGTPPTPDDALLSLVTGWVSHLGPTSARAWRPWSDCPRLRLKKLCLRMEASGAILRGKFTGCSRAPVARGNTNGATAACWHDIHRLTVATLRKQIEPVTAAQFMRWLLRGNTSHPVRKSWRRTSHAGSFAPAARFRNSRQRVGTQVLARRIADYDPKWLDQLCLTGAVGWGRLSPHPATLEVRRRQTPRDSHQRCAHHFLRP